MKMYALTYIGPRLWFCMKLANYLRRLAVLQLRKGKDVMIKLDDEFFRTVTFLLPEGKYEPSAKETAVLIRSILFYEFNIRSNPVVVGLTRINIQAKESEDVAGMPEWTMLPDLYEHMAFVEVLIWLINNKVYTLQDFVDAETDNLGWCSRLPHENIHCSGLTAGFRSTAISEITAYDFEITFFDNGGTNLVIEKAM